MFGKKRIRCKIVNYSDGTILQRATDSNHKKKYFIGNMKYCNKDNTVLEFTVRKAQRVTKQLNKLYGNDVWVVLKVDTDPFEVLQMTVLVIFLCMAFIGAGAGCIKRIYDKVEYRNRTRTNVKLENKIRTEWVQTIDEQLDKDNPKTGEMFSTLIFYYTKYGVPLFGRAFTTIEDAQRKLKKYKKLAEGCEWDYVCNLSTADSTSSIDFTGYERTARDYSKALSFYYLYNNYDRLYKYSCYTQDEVEQHLSNIKESYHQYPLIDAASPSKRLKTFVTEPKYKRI